MKEKKAGPRGAASARAEAVQGADPNQAFLTQQPDPAQNGQIHHRLGHHLGGLNEGAEFSGWQSLVVVDHEAKAVVVVGAKFDEGLAAVDLGAFGGRDEGPGGIAETEQNGVGTAGEGEGLGIEAVGGDAVAEKILTDDVRGAAAGDIERGVVDEGVSVARGIGEAVDERIGVGCEGEEVVDAVGAEVIHHLLGEDRHRGADVLEVGLEAGATQRLRGEVALVGRGIDLEGREHDSLVLLRNGRRLGVGGGAEGE